MKTSPFQPQDSEKGSSPKGPSAVDKLKTLIGESQNIRKGNLKKKMASKMSMKSKKAMWKKDGVKGEGEDYSGASDTHYGPNER